MVDVCVFVVGYGFVYPCEFCSCDFSCLADLNRHLDVFGRFDHVDVLLHVHSDLELTLSREHGGADKVVRDLEDIVLDRNRFARIRKKRIR